MNRSAVFFAAVCLAAPLASMQSQAQSGKIFDKTYPANGHPDLQVVVDNSAVRAHSCGGCREVHIHVDTGDMNLSDFKLQESQSGNLIRFSLKQPPMSGWHFGSRRQPEVTVTLPAEANVKLQADNGAMSLAGVSGNLDLHSDNGALTLTESRGSLRLTTDNGSITLERVEGALNARTDNGAITGDGRFSQVDARTDNGAVRLAALAGSTLSSGVHVTTSNGAVELKMQASVRADVDLHSDQGWIHCDLPLTNQNGSDDRHHIRGSVNGGGTIVRVTTDNGGITLARL